MNVLDRLLGVSPQVLSIRSQRMELIAANLANADTPGYKAVDVDFSDALALARGEQRGLVRTSENHLGVNGSGDSVRYRIPSQPSLDGNTVETDIEHSEFMQNAIRYQASLNFIDGRIKSALLALRGE